MVGGYFLLQGIFQTQGLHLSLASPALAGRFFTTCTNWEAQGAPPAVHKHANKAALYFRIRMSLHGHRLSSVWHKYLGVKFLDHSGAYGSFFKETPELLSIEVVTFHIPTSQVPEFWLLHPYPNPHQHLEDSVFFHFNIPMGLGNYLIVLILRLSGFLWWFSGYDFELPIQGACVPSLVREADPIYHM